ncbi:hypothetical protein A1OE_1356 [Candidatus Endolissoclinum faulkneri L2]|uniref:Uncharacterized protein n=1 Tax=Candidatus Endolissoclinum faulkneri L2 TaxID=1193729 RepID=K7Z5Z0_9PROT|nr:hypothetical protein A1OE_1356 [Candidatus Endolissoclinum faulkneri L2]
MNNDGALIFQVNSKLLAVVLAQYSTIGSIFDRFFLFKISISRRDKLAFITITLRIS